jgi:hypothetical protein
MRNENEKSIKKLPEASYPITNVPDLVYWKEEYEGSLTSHTVAFKWRGMLFGETWPIEDEMRVNWDRRRLIMKVKEALDVLVHHGKEALDSMGNVDPRLVADQEAIRLKRDPIWRERILALEKVLRIKDITREEAVKMGYL